MELVDGDDLSVLIAGGALPLAEALSDCPSDRRRARGRARAAHRPSRSEARQHQGPRRRHGEGARLRSRQSDGPGRSHRDGGRDAVADADGARDADGRRRRHRRLHGAGAGARQDGRSARRHLGLRRRPLRDAHRAAAVWRRGHHRSPRARARAGSRLDAPSGFTAAGAAPPARAMPDEGSEGTPPRHQRGALYHRRSHRRTERSRPRLRPRQSRLPAVA